MKKRFTLIELLIVIIVLGILIALLLPMLMNAKNRANVVRCVSNNRQLVVAAAMYSADNNGHLPFANWVSLEALWDGPGWLYDDKMGKDSIEHVENGVLWPYIGDYQIYRCPTDYDSDEFEETHNMTSYVSNGASVGYGNARNDLPGARVSNISVSDAILYWCQASVASNTWNDASSHPHEILNGNSVFYELPERHMNMMTAARIDGSADMLTVPVIYRFLQERPGPLWWNPYTNSGWLRD